MKSFALVLALLVATSNAFSPLLATRAVGKPAAAKKPVATVAVKKAAPKPVAKKAAPAPKAVAKKAAPAAAKPPAFLSGISLKVKGKPKINIQGPKTTRVSKKLDYVFDDGLTDLERKQRKSQSSFLTGSAKSQADLTSIRPELVKEADEYYFSPYDTTLATISVFVLISLIIKGGSPQL